MAALVAVVAGLASFPPEASAAHRIEGSEARGLRPLGHSRASPAGPGENFHSDLAFLGSLAFQGRFDGFRVLDVSEPRRPREVAFKRCNGAQGDVAVWGTLLFRAVDRPQTTRTCRGRDTPPGVPGFEGIQIFRISDPARPRLVGTVPVDCGAHTITPVPQPERERVLLYVSSSFPGFFGRSRFGNQCAQSHGRIPIVTVPLDRPRRARVLRSFPISGSNHCHDIAVHQGVGLAAGACFPGTNVWDVSRPHRPRLLTTFTVAGVDGWHSASFSMDGRVIVMGWEPGGGREPKCGRGDAEIERSVFFVDSRTGASIGRWTLGRTQSGLENCSIHDYAVAPVLDRDILVSGNYQSGVSVVDFTDPARPREIAFTDPPPLRPVRMGGAWGAYWYNGVLFASDMTRGLALFAVPKVGEGPILPHLNPQSLDGVQVARLRGAAMARILAPLAPARWS